MARTVPPTIGNVGYRSSDNPVALASWRFLKEEDATQVCPAHGPVWPMDAVL
jgi:glyoxylase-like metal-dependent hydrolase (beta-lactamase superfamily II)